MFPIPNTSSFCNGLLSPLSALSALTNYELLEIFHHHHVQFSNVDAPKVHRENPQRRPETLLAASGGGAVCAEDGATTRVESGG